jgi:NADH-quinone oxidoreductase subunit C
MLTNEGVITRVRERFGDALLEAREHRGQLTLELDASRLVEVCRYLRDEPGLELTQLTDVCGVDYSRYKAEDQDEIRDGPRFAVVYHLLSLKQNFRLRLRVYLDEDDPIVDSVLDIWRSADWYERETFDLFGILFDGHPDLRRILTDYGFIGHPFRKDFPLIGQVEMRYDPDKGRVIYQPVSISPRTLVPRVIREEGFGDRNP